MIELVYKDRKRLRKRYIGKAAKKGETTRTKMRKSKFIIDAAQRGNLVAQEYLEKLKNGNVRPEYVQGKSPTVKQCSITSKTDFRLLIRDITF